MGAKFDGIWTEEKQTDLLVVHKGKSHAETAVELTRSWKAFVSRDVVKNKYNRLIEFGVKPSVNIDEKLLYPSKNREFFDRTETDEGQSKKRVYFVTSAVAGCSLDKSFYKAVEVFCKDRKAKLVILPMRGAATKDEEYEEDVVEQLSENFYTDYTFNSNLEAFDLGLSPSQINPLTGIQRVTKRSSVIIASPKQDMETVPTSNSKIPHLIHSTGTITYPKYLANRVGQLASEDHVVGGLIVEVEDKDIFHIRQVRAGENGEFFDLDKKYSKRGVSHAKADSFVLGDIHAGSEDPTAMKAWQQVIDLTKPNKIFIHDLVDSQSISHHLEHNIAAKANRSGVYKTLESELQNVADFITTWSDKYPSIDFYVVRSNHDEHIERWLREARFVYDPQNYRLALELAVYQLDGQNVVQEYMNKRIGQIDNFHWLKRDDNLTIAGCQLAAHGDLGANGSRGTIASLEKSYQSAIVGHSHTPRILRDCWQVGTSTKLQLSYNKGPSSWLHASCLLYPNGMKSMIISIDGKWKL